MSDEKEISWSQIGCSKTTLHGLESLGFSAPTPIQKAVLPQAIGHKRDVIGAAETGSGKTLAFAIPILEAWLAEGRQNLAKDQVALFALVVAPTRELAIQINDVFAQLCAKVQPRSMHTVAIVGGMSEQKQQRLLKSRPDVIVATPGRLWALKQTGDEHLEDLSSLRVLVVDEIDRMLEQGHFEELRHIVQDIHRYLKEQRLAANDEQEEPAKPLGQLQTLIFSATLTFTHHIPVKRGEKAAATTPHPLADPKQKVKRIAQSMCMRKGKERLAVLDLTPPQKTPQTLIECRMNCMDLLQKDSNLLYLLKRYGGRTLVFGNSVSAIRRLVGVLRKLVPSLGVPLPRVLHGKMKEKVRLKSVESFEKSENAILLATDVAARGLDFQGVQTIIHYQVPKTTESYIHRSGRTARALRAGLSVLFVDPLDLPQYQKICRNLNKSEDLEVLAVDREQLMDACTEVVRLATEAESLEHIIKKKKTKDQWFERVAREADLVWEEGEEEKTRRNRDEEEPTREQNMGRRKNIVEKALRTRLRELEQQWKEVKKDDGAEEEEEKREKQDDTGEEGKEKMRKRLRLEKSKRKWLKRRRAE